jgi:HSP20 family protein
MLTRYYDGFRSPAVDVLDAFGFFSDLSYKTSKIDSINEEGIKIEMPGVKQENLDISVEGRTLKVVGMSRHGKEFSYSYALKTCVDDTAIEARLQDGLLEISLPKKAETKPRKIKIT